MTELQPKIYVGDPNDPPPPQIWRTCEFCYQRKMVIDFKGRSDTCNACQEKADRRKGFNRRLQEHLTGEVCDDDDLPVYPIYHLLRAAWEEGRLDESWCELLNCETGQHICGTCGMRHWGEDGAKTCCSELWDRPIDNLYRGKWDREWGLEDDEQSS